MARCKALSTYWQENQKRGLYTIPPHAQPRTSWRFSTDFPVSGPFPRWPRRPTIPPQLLPVFRSIAISRMLLPQQARAHGTMSVALSFASLRNTPKNQNRRLHCLQLQDQSGLKSRLLFRLKSKKHLYQLHVGSRGKFKPRPSLKVTSKIKLLYHLRLQNKSRLKPELPPQLKS